MKCPKCGTKTNKAVCLKCGYFDEEAMNKKNLQKEITKIEDMETLIAVDEFPSEKKSNKVWIIILLAILITIGIICYFVF